MAAVANSSHLKVPDTGLNYPCINTNQIAKQLIPIEAGGLLEKNRQLEVITSIDDNKNEIDNHLRWGVFLVFKGKNNYVKRTSLKKTVQQSLSVPPLTQLSRELRSYMTPSL